MLSAGEFPSISVCMSTAVRQRFVRDEDMSLHALKGYERFLSRKREFGVLPQELCTVPKQSNDSSTLST